jgi:hypothetical protein
VRDEDGKDGGMKNWKIAIATMFWVLGGIPVLGVQAADYKLAMSAEKDVCRLILTFANDKFHDKGLSSFTQLENLPDLEAPDFELVNWGGTNRLIPHYLQ